MAQTIFGFVVLVVLGYGDAYMWNQLTSHYQPAEHQPSPLQPAQQYQQPQYQQPQYQPSRPRQYAPSPYQPQQHQQHQQQQQYYGSPQRVYHGNTVNSYRTRARPQLLTSFASPIHGSQMNSIQGSRAPLKPVFLKPTPPALTPTSNPISHIITLGKNQTNLSLADLIGPPLAAQTTPLPPLDMFGQQPSNTMGQNQLTSGQPQSQASIRQLLSQNTNSLNQLQNEIGPTPMSFVQQQNGFGPTPMSFVQQQNSYGPTPMSFAEQQNSFSQSKNGYSQHHNSFPQHQHKLSHNQKHFGRKEYKIGQQHFGQQQSSFGQQPSSFGQGPLMPPRGAASGPLSMYKMGGAKGGQTTPTRSMMPVTPKIKLLVDKLALQLGHHAYYAAHGCVDPTTTLLGKQAQIAKFAMMSGSGCSSFQARHTCQMVKMSGAQAGGRMSMMMSMMLPQHTKNMFEQCMTPSTLMGGMTSMMRSPQVNPLRPPYGAASMGMGKPPKADCRQVAQMMMMSAPAEGGMFSPEGMEQIGIMRNKYLPMQCNENVIMGMFPLRMCCPGKVSSPSMQEAMMIKGMGGGGSA